MAEQIAHDVVKEAQSMGDAAPNDAPAKPANVAPAGNGQAHPHKANLDAQQDPAAAYSEERVRPDVRVRAEVNVSEPMDIPIDETDIQVVVADASGGSDTDTSKEAKGTAAGHVRSNSVKKLASFKSVSVTKNFLAKTVTAPTPKIGDKGTPPTVSQAAAQQTARPRLVAKSALGGLTRTAKTNGTAPDASKVWNKNRPTPPPVPRQFTDEELKQQYGIHMATRLQADEAGKESKWADIEDDEDDWAPEAVEWMDGTKSSVVPADAQPTPPPDNDGRAAVLRQDDSEDLSGPSPTPTQKTNVPVSSKTILKPGVHIQTLSKPNAPATDDSEKSSPTTKPTVPLATKNPWAPLPPIDKVAPVFPQPPPQQPPSLSPFRRDPHGFESLPPAPAGPAREIAADDFNRTWMDDRGPRELFDSKSGRYEPVGEMRRGPVRHDHGSRHPALLQRPPPHSDRTAPAEPSAAFQTRSTGTDGSWARRRTSSNVSAGSSGRRFSLSRPPEERVDNLSPMRGAVVESPQQQFAAAADMGVSPASAGQRSWPPNSPTFNTAQLPPGPQPPHLANGDTLPHPDEDPVERQARLMEEKKEATRLRKQREREEEAREEAARKERLRLKMAALGQATPSPELKEPRGKETAEQQAKSPRQPKALTISPPKPPIPTGDGEVAQYGVMKVHQPHPVRKGASAGVITEGSSARSVSETADQSGQAMSATSVPYGEHSAFGPHPTNTNSVAGRKIQDPHAPLEPMTWKTPSPHTTYNWGNNTNSNSNVWGPPQSKNRGLGNGTFNNDYNRIANTITHARTPESPGPIAPPHSINSFTRPALFDQQQLLPSSDSSQLPEHLIPSNLDNFDPPSTKMIFDQPGNQKAEARRFTADEWQRAANGGIQSKEAREAEEERIKAAFSAAAGLPTTNRASTGLVSQFKEQWIQTGIVGTYGPRKVIDKTTTEYNKPDNKKTENDIAVQLPSTTVNESQSSSSERLGAATMTTTQSQTSHASAATSSRPSRFVGFFPRHENNQSSANPDDSPPPDVSSLFFDDCHQPRVNLPAPKPVVKLPPAAASVENKLAQTPSDTATRTNINSVSTEMKHRVVALLEEMRVKPHSPAIASASKAPLDVAAHQGSTKVALPNSTTVTVADRASAHAPVASFAEPNSKPMAEELLEDREFASRPTVRLPKTQHENASLPVVPIDLLNGRAANSRSQRAVDIHSILAGELFADEESGGVVSIYVKLPGQSERRRLTARAQPRPRVSGRFNSNHGNGNKGRRSFGERRDGNTNGVSLNGRKASNSYRGGRNGNSRSGKPATHDSAVVAH